MLAVDGSKTEGTGKEAMETGSIGYSKLSREEKKDGKKKRKMGRCVAQSGLRKLLEKFLII